MARLAVLILPLAFAMVAAEVGYYVPKAFYTIDRFGHQSDPVPVPVPLFANQRFRRSAFGVSSSASASSSSSSNGFGQSQTFSVSSTNNNNGYDPYYNNNAGYNSGPLLVNRFGAANEGNLGSGVNVLGSSSGNQGGGVFSASSSTLGSDGKVHYSIQTGKF